MAAARLVHYLSVLCLPLAAIALAKIVEDDPRLFVTKFLPTATSVRYEVPTVLVFTTMPATCYSTLNVTGSCRRRRHLEEEPVLLNSDGDEIDIDSILPTPVRPKIDMTPLATSNDAPTIESSSASGQESNRGWTFSINIGPKSNVTRGILSKPFGFTYVSLATSTVTYTTYTTIISGLQSFTVVGCVPSSFAYSTC